MQTVRRIRSAFAANIPVKQVETGYRCETLCGCKSAKRTHRAAPPMGKKRPADFSTGRLSKFNLYISKASLAASLWQSGVSDLQKLAYTRHTQRSTACTHVLFASVFLLLIHYITFSVLCYLKFQLNPFAQYCKKRFPYDRYYIELFGLSLSAKLPFATWFRLHQPRTVCSGTPQLSAISLIVLAIRPFITPAICQYLV